MKGASGFGWDQLGGHHCNLRDEGRMGEKWTSKRDFEGQNDRAGW